MYFFFLYDFATRDIQFFLIAASHWSILTPGFFCLPLRVVSRNLTWTEQLKRKQVKDGRSRNGQVVWRTRTITGEKRLIVETPSFVLITKCESEKAPHLSCHVLCTSLWPNELSLPPLLYSNSVTASFTLDGRIVFAFFFFFCVAVVVLKCWLVLFSRWKYVSFCNLRSGSLRACALAWLYPGLSGEDMRGGGSIMFCFVCTPDFNMIIKGKCCMSGQKQCLHSRIEVYSAATVASLRHRGDVCSQSNQIKYLFRYFWMTPNQMWCMFDYEWRVQSGKE